MLSFVNDLRPVTFKWKAKSEIDSSLPDYNASKTTAEHTKKMYGLIAQEVKTVIDKYSLKDGQKLWMEASTDGRQRLAEGELIPFLTKALQELSAKNDALEARIKTLEDA